MMQYEREFIRYLKNYFWSVTQYIILPGCDFAVLIISSHKYRTISHKSRPVRIFMTTLCDDDIISHYFDVKISKTREILSFLNQAKFVTHQKIFFIFAKELKLF